MTPAGRVLVVDDNPITQKVIRLTLEAEGYEVVLAPDGRSALSLAATHPPDLILQDLRLPDIEGLDLVRRLRALPEVADAPIVAFSGFAPKMEEAKSLNVGFTDFLFKPVEPGRLLDLVRRHAPPSAPSPTSPGAGRLVLVVDDEPVQRKLAALRLRQQGFAVVMAEDGAAGLAAARQSPPAAIVADVLMPKLDGFGLCLAVRQDERLAHVPVVLCSNSYLERDDIELGTRMGATAYVTRTPDLREVLAALMDSLEGERGRWRPPEGVQQLTEEHNRRLIRQLERQALLSAGLAQESALQAAQLAILASVSGALIETRELQHVLEDILYRCLDAAGLSEGAIFLIGADGQPQLRAQLGYAEPPPQGLGLLLEAEDFLVRVAEGREPCLVPSDAVPPELASSLMERTGTASLLITPLFQGEELLGALVLASPRRDLGEWIVFARTVSAQISQAIVLTRSVTQLASLGSRMAHELRHPLAVLGNVHYLLRRRKGSRSPTPPLKLLDQMEREIARAGRLISDLLEFVEPPPCQPQSSLLLELIQEALEAARLPAGIAVDVQVDLGARKARLDRPRMVGALARLVDNAASAMPDGGSLVIRALRSNGWLDITVEDSGPGIGPDLLLRVFEPLYGTKPWGLGLGLPLARAAVAAHGGHLQLESHPGEGTRVHIRIPDAEPGV